MTYPESSQPASSQPESSPRSTALLWAGLAAGLLAAVVGGVAGLALGRQAEQMATRPGSTPVQPLPQQSPGSAPASSGSIAAVAADALPAVVSLRVTSAGGDSSGSGFVIRSDGFILTNNHVISSAVDNPDTSAIDVVFADGRRASAEVVGRNVSYDLAVLSVEVDGDLPVLPWARNDVVRVGDSVIAIGAPLGLAGTVTQGIVSALNRPVTTGEPGAAESYIDAIQTDAPINPGNSGGPLVDGSGRVIGVNSAIATLAVGWTSGSIGLGFAIPASAAERISAELIETGASSTPIIGVSLDSTYPGPGARVEAVTPGSPAAAAGLQPGDVITAVDGRSVADSQTLIIAIRANAPGDTIALTVRRGIDQFTVDVTLQARPDVP